MPVLAPVVINDGAATPVAHTFTPSNPDQNGTNYWYDRSGGIALGFPEISQNLREPAPNGRVSSSDRVHRAKIKATLPIMEVTSPTTGTGIQPAPTKAYELVFNGEFILPERSTLQNRKDILAYAKNLMAHATVSSLVLDLEGSY